METRGEVDRSFERLYRLHRSEVYRAALRELGNVHDAEDVTQAAFVDAYRAILRGSRPESPRAWLLAIAENVRRRRFRAARGRPPEQRADPDAVPSPELPHDQAQALLAALDSLPPLQREVFLLREIRGLTYEEIAAGSDASVGSVQMLLFRARRALRAELEPPSTPVRHALALSWPGWLVQLAGRGDRTLLTPRGAGAVGAAALVLGGSTAGLVELRRDAPQRAPVPSRVVTPATRADVRAAPAAVRRPARAEVRRTVSPGARRHGASPPSAPMSETAPVTAVPVDDAAPPASDPAVPPAAAAPPVQTPPPQMPVPQLPPVAEVVPALPDPPTLPLNPPAPPPVELPPPPIELPPLPPVVVDPPLPPPPTMPPPLPLP